MKKLLLVIGLILLSYQSVYAESGNEFVQKWQEMKKSEAGQSFNGFSAGVYAGYVNGISDAGEGLYFTIPKGSTYGQICSVVGKWIDDHPERWADDSAIIVLAALKETFPLQKKRK